MALIKCPECGKQISDSLQSCIHCGYKLNTTKQTATTNTAPIATQDEPSLHQIVCRAKSSSVLTRVLSCKPLFLTIAIFSVIFMLLFVIMFTVELSQGLAATTNLNEIFTPEKRDRAITFGKLFSIMFFIVMLNATVQEIMPICFSRQFWLYCKSNNINYVALANKELSKNIDVLSPQEKSQMAASMWYVKQALKYDKLPQEFSKDVIITLIKSIATIVVCIITVAFLMTNAENFANYVFVRSMLAIKPAFSFDWCEYFGLLIVSLILELAINITITIIRNNRNKIDNELFNQNFTDYLNNYYKLPQRFSIFN